MNEDKLSILQFLGYRVANFNLIENSTYTGEEDNIDIRFQSNIIKKPESEEDFFILLGCKVEENEKNRKNAQFYFNLDILGHFRFVEKTETSESFYKNALAILFPYLRSFLSTVSSQSGFRPVILPICNINKILDNKNNS